MLGDTLKLMLRKIVENKDVLKDEAFCEILTTAAYEFINIALPFNDRSRDYNLCGQRKTLLAIAKTCGEMKFRVLEDSDGIDLDWLLGDVEYIAEIVDFELHRNIKFLGHGPVTDIYGCQWEYNQFVPKEEKVSSKKV